MEKLTRILKNTRSIVDFQARTKPADNVVPDSFPIISPVPASSGACGIRIGVAKRSSMDWIATQAMAALIARLA